MIRGVGCLVSLMNTVNVRDDEDEYEDLLSKEDIMTRFEEIEMRWKVDPTPEGFRHLLEIFEITDADDLIPQRINDIHTSD